MFPFLRTLGGDGSTYAKHMEGARFTIPTPALLSKVVDLLADVPMDDRDTKGDLYEAMLGEIASAGLNGQFRTPSAETLTAEEHAKNNLPDVLTRWAERAGSERKRPGTAQSRRVPKADIVAQGYDL